MIAKRSCSGCAYGPSRAMREADALGLTRDELTALEIVCQEMDHNGAKTTESSESHQDATRFQLRCSTISWPLVAIILFVIQSCCPLHSWGPIQQLPNDQLTSLLDQALEKAHELERNQRRLHRILSPGFGTFQSLEELPQEKFSSDSLVDQVTALQNELEMAAQVLAEERQRRRNAEHAVVETEEATRELTEKAMQSRSQINTDISRLHRTLAVQTFGIGPHYAEFQILIWNGEESQRASFTIEFASLEQMPATVFTFMQQIHLGLWDNSSFSINAPHVLVAQPVQASATGTAPSRLKMELAGLARAPAVEYSPDYPHQAYTLGLVGGSTGQPGPNFYINKLDNSDHHAGEPCFAKVIRGHKAIDTMAELEGATTDSFSIQPVEIVKVSLVNHPYAW